MSKPLHRVIFHLIIGGLLMLIYPWESLFTGNQNIYFLWAAVKGGYGHLQADPLLQQADPYPVFTTLMVLAFKILPLATFQLIYWLINSVYSYSIFEISDRFTGIYSGIRSMVLFTILFLFFHSTQVWGTFMETATGADLRWTWDSGLAEQGLLRGYLQPSVFGVFMLLGVNLILKNKLYLAALAFAFACTIHANYLALSGIFMGVSAIYLIATKQFTKSHFGAMALFVGLTAPYLIYVMLSFMGDHAEVVQATVSNHIDDHLHFDPRTWLNVKTMLQFAAFIAFLFLFGKTSIGKWISGLVITAVVLSIVAFLMPQTPLISLTPWRVSVVAFPIAFFILLGLFSQSLRPGKYVSFVLLPVSAILVSLLYLRVMGSGDPSFQFGWQMTSAAFVILALIAAFFARKMPRALQVHLNNTSAVGLLFLLLFSGGIGKWVEYRTHQGFTWKKVQDHIQTTASSGDLYMVPPSMVGFRMNAGAAVYSDNLLVHGSTLPQQYERRELTEQFYDAENPDASDFDKLREEGITHVIVPSNFRSGLTTSTYSDDSYSVLELK